MEKEKKYIVISTFNGMGCIWLALDKAGIKVSQRISSEIDKYAIKVNDANYPDTIQIGDITKVQVVKNDAGRPIKLTTEDKTVDLLDDEIIFVGGSPCQGFSIAGKGLNFEDPRSKLFFEFHRLMVELAPKYFLLENVRMLKEHEVIISQYMQAEPIMINSALLSAQNRVRLYWTNINLKEYNLFGDKIADIPQPKDKEILLKHILQPIEEVAEKYYLSEKMVNYLFFGKDNFNNGKINFKEGDDKASCINASSKSIDISDNIIVTKAGQVGYGKEFTENDKGQCLLARDYKGLSTHGINVVAYKKNTPTESIQIGTLFENNAQAGRIYSDEGKSVSITALGGGLGAKTGLYKVEGCAMRGRNPENPKSREAGLPTQQMIETRTDGKTNCLTNVQKDSLVKITRVKQINDSKESGGVQPYQQNRIYDVEGQAPALNSEMGGERTHIVNTERIRRLTPIECERLQTVPDNYTNHVSDSQRYKMLGNGWTVDVIAYIFSFMK